MMKYPNYNFVYYYNLLSAQLIQTICYDFQNSHIVSENYKYFLKYPIPINNIIMIPEYQFLLLNTARNWLTPDRCPEIENYFYRQNIVLKPAQPYLTTLMKTGKTSITLSKRN